MKNIEFEFETKRLRVFAARMLSPTQFNTSRIVYTAWDKTRDLGHPAVVCVVLPRCHLLDASIEWIETMEDQRRKGFATELVEWLMVIHPGLEWEGITQSGIAFSMKFVKKHP